VKRGRAEDALEGPCPGVGRPGPHPGRALVVLVALALCWLPSAGSAAEEAGPAAGAPAAETRAASEAGLEAANPDPWEKMNRGIFAFNEAADVYVLVPVARGWRWVTPHFLHVAIRNFNGLILMPTILFNNVLQLKGEHVMEDIGRIMVNVSFGLLGLVDVASMMGLPANDEGFGQTLGYWGASPGPYLVLPLFGPSTVRGGIGRLGDGAGTFYFSWLPIWATFLVRGVDIISWRSDLIEEIALTRRESLDYYVFQREAYLQFSQARVNAARGVSVTEPANDADLYFFDDGYEEEEDDDDDARDGDQEDVGREAEMQGLPVANREANADGG